MLPKRNRIIGLFILSFLCIASIQAQNIEVLFSNIRSPRGQIVVKVFKDDKGFDEDKPFRIVKFPKAGIIKGEMTGKLSLEPGTYGLALLDDENSNGEMEYNFVHMPKEGFGFSNYYLTGLSKPHFEKFQFTLNKDQKPKINMKIRYL